MYIRYLLYIASSRLAFWLGLAGLGWLDRVGWLELAGSGWAGSRLGWLGLGLIRVGQAKGWACSGWMALVGWFRVRLVPGWAGSELGCLRVSFALSWAGSGLGWLRVGLALGWV